MAPPAVELNAVAGIGEDVHEARSIAQIKGLNLAGDVKAAQSSFVADEEIPSLSEIKSRIPQHCFRPNILRSLSYVARDALILGALYYGAYATHGTTVHYAYLPVFWFFTGFFMWAVFVLGHDCGHGSFSRYRSVNYFVGHLLHTPILVPFHSWRISHRKHHKNTGNYEKDEIFYPMTESEYSGIVAIARFVYKELFFCYALAFPIYLVKGYGNGMSNASHLSSHSELFIKEERSMVNFSIGCWWAMLTSLTGLSFVYGFVNMFVYYWIPYLIYCWWLLMVTFLHHTEPGTRWYNTRNWSYVKGNLESVDRIYGLFEHFHHDIGTHVVHHLFPAIPHYHLCEANKAVKPFLGALHKIEKEGPARQLVKSMKAWHSCHVIPDSTDLFVIPEA